MTHQPCRRCGATVRTEMDHRVRQVSATYYIPHPLDDDLVVAVLVSAHDRVHIVEDDAGRPT